MVENQLIARGINDARVIRAFLKVPRHLFVPEGELEEAYDDHPLPIGDGQTISQPYMVALMTQCLELKGDERVLEVGTGSGYQTAILAELAREVYTIERIEGLAKRAKDVLTGLGYENIHYRVGDGTEGWEEFAPYDAIIVTAAAPKVPPPLIEQLAEGGRLVAPIGRRFGQELVRVRKEKGRLREEDICGCVFVPLIGKYGWRKEDE